MTIRENEAVASLKILAAIARADGSVHNDERRSLAAALDNLELTTPVKIEELLADGSIDVQAELAKLESEEAREQIYRSAFFMAHADGTCTKEEQAILDLVARETQISDEARQSLSRIFTPPRTSLAPTKLTKVDDAEQRAQSVKSRITRYAVLTAVLGAFPIPGVAIVTDLAVVALQLKMVRDIGRLWGHDVDRNAAKSMLYTMGLGTGARLAVNNLAKLLPGWGSAIGATTSFASTFALGRVIEKFFAADAKVDLASLKPEFDAAHKEGKAAYKEQKEEIARQEIESKRTLDLLTEDVKKGIITQDELERRVAEMSESRE
ncbi:MAG: TerB family tellurite resistance protein [Deltaproteobacteria bacterium]|nr:TerB family tellurite resistance protein [Deltaproteobacteria bacterium]